MWLSLDCSNAFSYFILFLIRNSTPNTCLSVHIKEEKNPDLWRTELLYAFLFITENNPHTFKCTRCTCSALPIARKFFLLLTFCFAHSFLHCHNWIHKTVLSFCCFINGTFFRKRARMCTEIIEESPVLKKNPLTFNNVK